MGILNRINPFVQVMYDDKLNAKRKNLDAALTLVFLVVVIVYCVDSVNTWLNPHVYTSKCLTTGDGLDPMTIKELCYTPEKPYEPALSAFTCRGTFGAEVWGITAKKSGGGRMLNNNNPPPQNNNNPPPNNNNNNNNNPPANNNNNNNKNNNEEIIFPTTEALQFCANVMKDDSKVLRPFGLKDAAEDNIKGGILGYNKDKTYKLYGDSDNKDYYEITEHKSFTSTFTCCGWSKMSTSNRILGYLAAVGGFAGFIKALLASIPPHHHPEDETKSDQVTPTEKAQESI